MEGEFAVIRVEVNQDFNEQFLKFDGKLAALCRIHSLEKQHGGSGSRSSLDPLKPSLIELEMAESIKFSAEPQDMALPTLTPTGEFTKLHENTAMT